MTNNEVISMMISLFGSMGQKRHIAIHICVGTFSRYIAMKMDSWRLDWYIELVETCCMKGCIEGIELRKDVMEMTDKALTDVFEDSIVPEDTKDIDKMFAQSPDKMISETLLLHSMTYCHNKIMSMSDDDVNNLLSKYEEDDFGIIRFDKAEDMADEVMRETAKTLGIPSDIAMSIMPDLIPVKYSIQPRKPRKRRDLHKQHVPNYSYIPKGNPDNYYQKKMKELSSWRVEDENNVKYALRVFEGWLEQAEKFSLRSKAENKIFYKRLAFSIADNVIWYFPRYYYHERLLMYEKQHPRMKKMLKEARRILQANFFYGDEQELSWFLGNAETLKQKPIYQKDGLLDMEEMIEEIKNWK